MPDASSTGRSPYPPPAFRGQRTLKNPVHNFGSAAHPDRCSPGRPERPRWPAPAGQQNRRARRRRDLLGPFPQPQIRTGHRCRRRGLHHRPRSLRIRRGHPKRRRSHLDQNCGRGCSGVGHHPRDRRHGALPTDRERRAQVGRRCGAGGGIVARVAGGSTAAAAGSRSSTPYGRVAQSTPGSSTPAAVRQSVHPS